MSAFVASDVQPLGNGAGPLAGRCVITMTSGMCAECRIYRNKDNSGYSVGIAGSKTASGKYEPVITFVTAERAKQWTAAALQAIQPHLHLLAAPVATAPKEVPGGFSDF